MLDIASKLKLLTSDRKKEVENFIDFLLMKNDQEDKSTSKDNWKNNLLEVSTWSKNDIEVLIQNIESNSNWSVEEW